MVRNILRITSNMHKGTQKCSWGSVSMIFVLIGGVNWGLIGVGGFIGSNLNVINLIFGGAPVIEWIIYILVGLAALKLILGCSCKACKGGACGAGCSGCGNCESSEHKSHESEAMNSME